MRPARFAPLYRWPSQTLHEEIAGGAYKPGDMLPTDHELMRRYSLSITTVRRAVHDLAREGLIYHRAGKSTFVRCTKIEENLLRLTSFAEEMQTHNIKPRFKLGCAENVISPPPIGKAVGLPENGQAVYIERAQMAEREPIALTRGYWVGERLAGQDLSHIPLHETLETIFHISLGEAIESISAQMATADIARQIGVRAGAPLLVRQRIIFSSDRRPGECTTTFYRADRYEYKVRLQRQAGI